MKTIPKDTFIFTGWVIINSKGDVLFTKNWESVDSGYNFIHMFEPVEELPMQWKNPHHFIQTWPTQKAAESYLQLKGIKGSVTSMEIIDNKYLVRNK